MVLKCFEKYFKPFKLHTKIKSTVKFFFISKIVEKLLEQNKFNAKHLYYIDKMKEIACFIKNQLSRLNLITCDQ